MNVCCCKTCRCVKKSYYWFLEVCASKMPYHRDENLELFQALSPADSNMNTHENIPDELLIPN